MALVALGLGVLTHPMHTSVAELRYDPATRQANVAIRLYRDDLGETVTDSALAHYVNGRFVLDDRRGRALRLEWLGVERVADALVIRLRGLVPAGLDGARIAHLLLHDRFEDQVNVVRASYGSRTTTLLFLPGDGPKRLP